MLKEIVLKKIFFNSIAILWGITIGVFFRFSLDQLQPFWDIRISFLVYILIATIWLSFFWHFHSSRSRSKKSFFYYSTVLINTGLFLFLIYWLGYTEYLLIYPFLFSLQVILHFFLLATKLPYFLFYQLPIAIGIFIGVLPIEYFQKAVPLFLFSSSLIIFSSKFLYSVKPANLKGSRRMLFLRVTLDFIRFLFIGFAFIGIFDLYRTQFYILVSIFIIGLFLHKLIQKFQYKKSHIRYGIMILPFLFIILSASYPYLAFSYWAIAGYFLLAIWKTLYLIKPFDGYLRREYALLGLIILLSLFAHFLTIEWGQILLVGLIFMSLIFIYVHVLMKYRPNISFLLFISVLIWGGIFTYKFWDIHTKDIWELTSENKGKVDPISVFSLAGFQKGSHFKTNLFPKNAIELINHKQKYHKGLEHFNVTPVFMTLYFKILSILNDEENTIFLIDLKEYKPYLKTNNRNKLFRYISELDMDHIHIFYTKEKKRMVFNDSQGETEFIHPASYISEEEEKFIYDLGISILEYYEENEEYQNALNIGLELKKNFPHNIKIIRKLAFLHGVLAQVNKQIEYLEYLINTQKSRNIKDHHLLIDLYIWQNEFSKAEEMIQKTLLIDPENTIAYHKLSYKVLEKKGNQYDWNRLYNKIKLWKPVDEELILEKEKLLQNIQSNKRDEGYKIKEDAQERELRIILPE